MSGIGSAVGGERYHALDAVRGGALILGVFFHAILAYLPGPQLWPVIDASRSTELSVTFFVLHIFRMTLFFVLAGFFARLLIERLGVGKFVLNRAKRIGIPLAMFWPITMVGIVTALIWGAVHANGGTMPEGPPPPPMTAETFPLTHLWFLYVLLFFYAGAIVLRTLVHVIDRGGFLRGRVVDPLVRLIGGPLAPLFLALPVGAALYLTPTWYAWFGIPTPDHGLIPNATAMVIYGLAFGFGWLLNRQPEVMFGWAKVWPLHAIAAIGATVACLVLAGPLPIFATADGSPKSLAYTALYAFATWAWTTAIIGFAVRFLSGHSPARRYLADASYWIYLIHLPLVMLLQAAMLQFPWPWFVKYPAVIGIAFVIMLASYQWLVRYSWIGAILNGKRQKPARREKPSNVVVAAE